MYTVNYAIRRSEIWCWYWRAWTRPAGLWRIHVMFGMAFASFFTVVLEPEGFRLTHYLAIAAIVTAACVILFPLWPQLRFKSAVRTLTISPSGIVTVVGTVSGSRSWKDMRSIEQSNGTIVFTGINRNAFIVPNRAFATGDEREQFLEAARQWHSLARA